MNAEQLKKSLLQMAMQGKLVEQREEEGNARELLEKIQQEKQRLIKEGKIKKEKSLPEITENEKPFDIPENWVWTRLGNVVNIVSARRVHQADWKTKGVPFYRAREINKLSEKGFVDNELFISEELFQKLSQNGFPKEGDLMVTAVGTLGKSYIVNKNDRFYYKDASVICFENFGKISPEFLRATMMSPYMLNTIKSNSSGTTVGTITIVIANNYLIPLPPLAEQRRIVQKLEQLLPLVEAYGKAQSELKAMEAALPEQLKKSLLQMAMQGKLVEQREEEGKAQDLLEKIQQEKQRLIKEGKIKKEKKLPEITENEKPFDIPENWVWVRLRQLVYNKGQKTPDTDFCYIDIGSIDNASQKLGKENTVLTPSEAPSRARKIVSSGDILYSTVRPYLHNMCILDRDFPFPPIASTGFAVMTCLSGCFNRFLFYYLMSPDFDRYANSTNNAKGIAYPAINDEKLYRALIPLPPLAEQQRIVEKLEQLLPLCDKLIGN